MMMSLQNREIVAHEGRYDLPFLFCMFGRHGPAMALLIALFLFMMGLFSISRKVLALFSYLRREAHCEHMEKDAVVETTELPKSDMQVPRVFYRIGDTWPEKRAGYIPNRNIEVSSQKQHNEDARDHSTVDSIDFVACQTDSSDVHSIVVSARATDTLHQQPQANEIHITDNSSFDMESDEGPTVEHTTGLFVGNLEEVCLDNVETQAEEMGEGCKKRELDREVTMENIEQIPDGHNQSIPWIDLSVLSRSQNQSPPEQHPSKEHYQDSFIDSDITSPSEEVPEGPEDDVCLDQNTVESADVVECKTDSSDVYSTVASAMDTDTLHQQPWINEEILITDNNNFDEEPDKDSTVECPSGLSEGNVEELCLDNVETQAEEMGECGKKMELDMAATRENLSGPVCVESQSHPEKLAPTEPYEECFITKAAEHPDISTHTAEVKDKTPNEEDFINVDNTVESTDVVEFKSDSSDVGSTLAFAMDTDTPALFSGSLPKTVDQREEVVSASDDSGPGLCFEDSRDLSIASTSERSATQRLTGSHVSPSTSQEDSGPAGSNVIPGSDLIRQNLNTTETQKSQLDDLSEAIRYGSHSAPDNQQPPIREEIHFTDNINVDEEPDEDPSVEHTTGLSVGTQAEEIGEGCKRRETDRGATMENSGHITDGNNQSIPWTDLSVLSCSQNQSPPEQHPSKEHYQDSFIDSDFTSPSEEIPEGPEDDVCMDQNTVESTDVIEYKTNSSDVYITVASAMDTDTLHQQPKINEEIHITDNNNFVEEPIVECTTGLSEGNVEELCLDNIETQSEEMGECGKKMELDMAETLENLCGPLFVKSQSPPETLVPTEPYDECVITKAAEHQDTNTHTAEVTDKKPNEEDFINVHNTVESTDIVEYKTDSSDVNSTVAPAIDKDTLHQQPQANEEIHGTDKIDFDEEPDEVPTITTDTTTRSNMATETSQTFEDENSDTMCSVIVAKVPVSFGVQYFTHSPGQNLAVTGNHQDLGSWTGFLPLEEKEDGYWSRTMRLPSMIQVEWKFVVVDEAGEVHRWEECDNRWFETGSDAHSCVKLHKRWGTQ